MELVFSGKVWYWKGPAPWYFVSVPEDACRELEAASDVVSYGWGMVPVTVHIGSTSWNTSLWPKDGGYIVPLKAAARKAEDLDEGDTADIRLVVDL